VIVLFLETVERTANVVKVLIKEKKVKLFTQFDTDGLTSASIICKMLLRENVNFQLRVFKQLTSEIIDNLNVDENDFLILTDFGSGQLNSLKPILEKTHVLILDHHEPQKLEHLNLFHINPLLFNDEELSSSIIAYLLAKFMDIKNADLIDLAIVGAVGDEVEEKWKFKGFAKKILEEAETISKISITKGLRLYGRNSKPIYQSLAYSFDPFIPNISGSESYAIQFLSELGIDTRSDDEWKKMKDLTIDEQQRLAAAIIKERIKTEEVAEDIFGDIYTMIGRPDELQDVREFSTLLNACGRTDKASVGIRLCLGDYSILSYSWEILGKYKKSIGDGLKLIRGNGFIRSTDFGNYILAGDRIKDTIIGTITSMALNSNIADSTKPVFGFAETGDGKIKVSARAPRNLEINLKQIIVDAVERIGCKKECGGHKLASGAFIPKGKEEEFITTVDSLLGEIIGSKES